MSLQKLLWVAVAMGVMAGTALADPMRTVFTKENKFPGAMGWEVGLAGEFRTYEEQMADEDMDWWAVGPQARFGITDRVAVRADIPLVGWSMDDEDESGLGDISLGLDFLFFEDIFEYAWIIPHATAILPTGDEDDGLGVGEGQGRFGVSVGTTVNDVLHFGADVSYTVNGTWDDMHDEREELITGALSLVWDLDDQASLLGEVQLRDDPVDDDDDYALHAHGGMSYRINEWFSLMGYFGGASGGYEDYYGMGRLVCQF